MKKIMVVILSVIMVVGAVGVVQAQTLSKSIFSSQIGLNFGPVTLYSGFEHIAVPSEGMQYEITGIEAGDSVTVTIDTWMHTSTMKAPIISKYVSSGENQSYNIPLLPRGDYVLNVKSSKGELSEILMRD